jgi:hypothetical protein
MTLPATQIIYDANGMNVVRRTIWHPPRRFDRSYDGRMGYIQMYRRPRRSNAQEGREHWRVLLQGAFRMRGIGRDRLSSSSLFELCVWFNDQCIDLR